jgi:hypothetical protein
MTDPMHPDRWTAAEALDQATEVTDDRCQGRCADLRDWFTWECRGLMDDEESHQVLDMVLNRLASDGLMREGGE